MRSFAVEWELEFEDALLEARESTLMDLWGPIPLDVKMRIIRFLVVYGPLYFRHFRSRFLQAVRRGMPPRAAYRYVKSSYPPPPTARGRGKLTAAQVKQYQRRRQQRLPSKWRRRRYRRQRY